MTDHNPLDGGHDGPSRPIEWKFGIIPMMFVLPQNTEVKEMTAGGHLRVTDGPFDYPFFGGGYGVLYTTTAAGATGAVATSASSKGGRAGALRALNETPGRASDIRDTAHLH